MPPDVPSGAMIALAVGPGDAASLAVTGGEPADELHCTLVYLPNAADMTPEQVQAMTDTASAWAAAERPFAATIGATSNDFGSPDEPCTVALVDCAALPAARQRLVEAINAAGLQESQDHGFTPHITLAYGAGQAIAAPKGMALTLKDVIVAVGGAPAATIPVGPAAAPDPGPDPDTRLAGPEPRYWQLLPGLTFDLYPRLDGSFKDGGGKGNKGNAKDLKRWYEEGADGQIHWCKPGDFRECVAVASRHIDRAEGFCQERHIHRCGAPAGHAPGEKGHHSMTSFGDQARDADGRFAGLGSAVKHVAKAFGIHHGKLSQHSAFKSEGEKTLKSLQEADKRSGSSASQGFLSDHFTKEIEAASKAQKAGSESAAAKHLGAASAVEQHMKSKGMTPHYGKIPVTAAGVDLDAGYREHTVRAVPGAPGHNGDVMPPEMLTRDDIIHQSLTAAAVAHAQSYAWSLLDVLDRTGEPAYWLGISQADRDKAAKSGAAMPDGSYPVLACDGSNSVDSAVAAVGRGSASHDAIRRHIAKRAGSLGCADKIPDNWNADGSLKVAASVRVAAAAASLTESLAAPVPPPPPHVPPPPMPGGAAKPAAPAAKAPPVPAKPAAGKTDDEVAADAGTTTLIGQLKALLGQAIAAQEKDPNVAKDPTDAKVLAGLQAMDKLVDQVVADQDADNKETNPAGDGNPAPAAPAPAAKPDAPDVPMAAPPAAGPAPARPGAPAPDGTKPGNSAGIPGDADDSPPSPGDIEADVPCENPDCGHLGAVHENLADGKNTGSCQTPGCSCPGMVPHAEQVVGPDETTGGPNNDGGDAAPSGDDRALVAADPPPFPPAHAPAPHPPTAPAPPTATPTSAQLPPWNPDPSVPVGPEFTIPVGWIEGVQTSDGRVIDPDALTWRTPPIALMGLKTSPHDPSGMSQNDPAVWIGSITSVDVEDGKGTAHGHLFTTDDADEWAQIIAGMGRAGVSIDVGAAITAIDAPPVEVIPMPAGPGAFDDPMPAMSPPVEHVVKGEIMGITVCPFPAFPGAYVVMGDGSNVDDLPKLPEPTPAQASMGIRYVDAAACEPCADAAVAAALAASGGTPIVQVRERLADGVGPLYPPRAWFEDPTFADGDDRLQETIDSKTGRPSGKFACPLTITADGRVYGHVAQWGVCHQAPAFMSRGQCILAPRSKTGYSWFHGRGSLITAEGDLLGVGRLTAGTGHASTQDGVSAAMAIAHYDNAGLTAASVRAGEDDFGIWVAGSTLSDITPAQVARLRLCPPSGDWRPVGAGQELVAVLAVNEPGFPVARATIKQSTGRALSLVAAGVPMFETPSTEGPTLADQVAALTAGLRAEKAIRRLSSQIG